MNEESEYTYRLPTEAEWEYAARGGRNFSYAGSDDLAEIAWHEDNSQSETHLLGGKRPNALGLFDMSGNVDEWCQDWYDAAYYQDCVNKGIEHNPPGPSEGRESVVRGGSWLLNLDSLRVSVRDFDIGLRLSRY